MQRTYFDHAATSWPKPPGVMQAMVGFEEDCGAAAGRASYRSAATASQYVARVRSRLAGLINAKSSQEIALLHNGTAALNLALSGLLKTDDHVVTTAAEHNSMLRPLAYLERTRGIHVTIVPVDETGAVALEDVHQAINQQTRMIATTHASNVTGRLQPIDVMAEIAHRHSAIFLVDAAQTLGYLPIDVQHLGIDLLAAPGHKGVGGPLGTGLLYANQRFAAEFDNPTPGGTGTDSENLVGPFAWPSGVEAGNLNTPAIAGWDHGLEWLTSRSIAVRWQALLSLKHRLTEILSTAEFGHLIGHGDEEVYVPVISIAVSELACSDLAAILDSSFGIETRAGLHCAGAIHHCLDTHKLGGTLRFSLGHSSTMEDLDRLENACRELCSMLPVLRKPTS